MSPPAVPEVCRNCFRTFTNLDNLRAAVSSTGVQFEDHHLSNLDTTAANGCPLCCVILSAAPSLSLTVDRWPQHWHQAPTRYPTDILKTKHIYVGDRVLAVYSDPGQLKSQG
jgi:hypothetical protein